MEYAVGKSGVLPDPHPALTRPWWFQPWRSPRVNPRNSTACHDVEFLRIQGKRCVWEPWQVLPAAPDVLASAQIHGSQQTCVFRDGSIPFALAACPVVNSVSNFVFFNILSFSLLLKLDVRHGQTDRLCPRLDQGTGTGSSTRCVESGKGFMKHSFPQTGSPERARSRSVLNACLEDVRDGDQTRDSRTGR